MTTASGKTQKMTKIFIKLEKNVKISIHLRVFLIPKHIALIMAIKSNYFLQNFYRLLQTSILDWFNKKFEK